MEEQSVATRVAYVKFMAKTFAKRETESEAAKEGEEEVAEGDTDEKTGSRKTTEVRFSYFSTSDLVKNLKLL